MYRRPNAAFHENLTDVMDDILIRLQNIEAKLNKMEKED